MEKRRWTAFAGVILALAIITTACNEDVPPVATPEPTEEAPAFETLKPGVLQVASCLDYAPFESVEGGDEIGFDVDLAEEIAKRLDLTVEWIRTDFDSSFTALAGDQFDMIAAAVTATGDLGAERDDVVDFSAFYFNSKQALTVNTTETPDIASGADLGDAHTVGVQKGTTGATYAVENFKSQGTKIKTFQAASDAFRDLEAGNITAVVNDELSSVEEIKELQGLEIKETYDTDEKYAFAFSPNNPELREAADEKLAEIIEDGTYETIFVKWFPGVEVPPEYAAAA